ncbi:MAG: hypothetical protein ACLTDR_10395 [Adlercreutzia equolifaciens]
MSKLKKRPSVSFSSISDYGFKVRGASPSPRLPKPPLPPMPLSAPWPPMCTTILSRRPWAT